MSDTSATPPVPPLSPTPHAPPMTMERSGQALIVRLNSKMMDDHVLKSLAELIDQNAGVEAGVAVIVLDLTRVQIVPSLALGLILQTSKKCRANQQRLKLAGVIPQVRQVFAVTRLDRLLDFSESVAAALE
jgi:anti-anti-sigma factor